MKTEKQFVDWIEKQIDYYSPILGIQLQKIDIEKKDKEDDLDFLGITCSYPYLEPILRYSDKAFKEWKNGYLKQDRILHELCHIITDPLYIKAIERYGSKEAILEERERLTDTICVIIKNLLK